MEQRSEKSILKRASETEHDELEELREDVVFTQFTAQQYQMLVTKVYQEKNPSMLGDLAFMFSKYEGREEELFSQVCLKYGANLAALTKGLPSKEVLELPEDELVEAIVQVEAENERRVRLLRRKREEVKELVTLIRLGSQRRRCHACDLNLCRAQRLVRFAGEVCWLVAEEGRCAEEEAARSAGEPEIDVEDDLLKGSRWVIQELKAILPNMADEEPRLAELAHHLAAGTPGQDEDGESILEAIKASLEPLHDLAFAPAVAGLSGFSPSSFLGPMFYNSMFKVPRPFLHSTAEVLIRKCAGGAFEGESNIYPVHACKGCQRFDAGHCTVPVAKEEAGGREKVSLSAARHSKDAGLISAELYDPSLSPKYASVKDPELEPMVRRVNNMKKLSMTMQSFSPRAAEWEVARSNPPEVQDWIYKTLASAPRREPEIKMAPPQRPRPRKSRRRRSSQQDRDKALVTQLTEDAGFLGEDCLFFGDWGELSDSAVFLQMIKTGMILSDENVQSIQRIFQQFCDEHHVIPKDLVPQALEAFGTGLKLTLYQVSPYSQVDLTDFRDIIEKWMSKEHEFMEETFKSMDKDSGGSGRLSSHELFPYLAAVGIVPVQSRIKEVVELVDPNDTGSLNFQQMVLNQDNSTYLTRLRRGPGDLQAQFLPPPRLRGPVGSMAPLGYQPGRLMAHLVTSFVEPGKAEGAGMAMKPDPVADSLPLDIHVIIKKASGGIGGVQVTKPSAVGGLNPEVAAVAAGAPKAAKAAMCTLAPRYVLPQHGGRRGLPRKTDTCGWRVGTPAQVQLVLLYRHTEGFSLKEVKVLRGICARIPEGCVLSVRAGATRRQAPVSSDRPFRFNCSLEEASPFKVDVLEPVATARLILRPGEERRTECQYTIPLEPSNSFEGSGPSGPSPGTSPPAGSNDMFVTIAVSPSDEQQEEEVARMEEEKGPSNSRIGQARMLLTCGPQMAVIPRPTPRVSTLISTIWWSSLSSWFRVSSRSNLSGLTSSWRDSSTFQSQSPGPGRRLIWILQEERCLELPWRRSATTTTRDKGALAAGQQQLPRFKLKDVLLLFFGLHNQHISEQLHREAHTSRRLWIRRNLVSFRQAVAECREANGQSLLSLREVLLWSRRQREMEFKVFRQKFNLVDPGENGRVEFTDLTRLVGLGPSLESEWIFRYVTYVTHMTDTCNEQKSSKRT
eukprot:g3853.t1